MAERKTLGEIRDEEVAQAYEDGRRSAFEEMRGRQLDADLQAYRVAPSGEGPHAADWKDEPHRLVYDLVQIAQAQRNRLDAVREYVSDAMDEQLARRLLAPGSRDAVIKAVRLLSGEAPEYLEDSDQWTLPNASDGLYDAVRCLVSWLDEHATKGNK